MSKAMLKGEEDYDNPETTTFCSQKAAAPAIARVSRAMIAEAETKEAEHETRTVQRATGIPSC